MDEFYVLNRQDALQLPEKYEGYVIYYKKSKDEKTALIQQNLFVKLIENALKLSTQNFLFADVSSGTLRLSEIQRSAPVKKCFLFGVNEREIGTNFDANSYRLTTVSGIQFLKADAPEIIESDKNLKNKLWTQLQLSFNIPK
jgi:hypothetical protein